MDMHTSSVERILNAFQMKSKNMNLPFVNCLAIIG